SSSGSNPPTAPGSFSLEPGKILPPGLLVPARKRHMPPLPDTFSVERAGGCQALIPCGYDPRTPFGLVGTIIVGSSKRFGISSSPGRKEHPIIARNEWDLCKV